MTEDHPNLALLKRLDPRNMAAAAGRIVEVWDIVPGQAMEVHDAER